MSASDDASAISAPRRSRSAAVDELARRARHRRDQVLDARPERRVRAHVHALVAERVAGHLPAAVDLADHHLVGHEQVLDEDLVEHRQSADLLQRPDVEAPARTCRPMKYRPCRSCLGFSGDGAGEQDAPLATPWAATSTPSFWPLISRPPSTLVAARSARGEVGGGPQARRTSGTTGSRRAAPAALELLLLLGRAVLEDRRQHPVAHRDVLEADPRGLHLLLDLQLARWARRPGRAGRAGTAQRTRSG